MVMYRIDDKNMNKYVIGDKWSNAIMDNERGSQENTHIFKRLGIIFFKGW